MSLPSASRVYDVAIKTPVANAVKASQKTGRSIYLKREDLQPVHSFKLRGAYNKIAQLSDDERSRGVIAASAGNHAQGVALAAQKLEIDALVIMPRTTPSIKVDAVKSYGATVELAGDNYSEAAEHCKQRIQQTGRTFIHPFDDPLVIAGQGTVGQEILEQLPEVTHIFVPVGGGGLIAGVAQYVKKLRPDVQVISVEPQDSNALQTSIAQDRRVMLPHVGIFADGVAVKQVGETTFRIAKESVDDFTTVTTDQICAAIKTVFEDTRSIVEPAGALALAGAMHYALAENARAVAVCSGANMTFERLGQVAERTLLGSGREIVLGIELPETPGALARFCTDVVNGHTINEFSYRKAAENTAHAFIGLAVNDTPDKQTLMNKLHDHGYTYTDFSDSDIAKEHTRHMIGGRGTTVKDEHIYEVTFPERPRALAGFLHEVGTSWNISLFHYRSAASDYGRVLIGFEASDQGELETKLASTGFDFIPADTDASLGFFIR